MSERRVLAPRLRELDEELAARGMPPGARARVAERLRREAIAREATAGFRFRWLPAITFAAGAALVLLVVGLGLRPRPQAIEPDPVASVLGIFTVEGEHCRYRSEAGRAVLDGSCRLVAPHLTMQTWDRVVLRDDDGLRIDEGTALLEVAHVSSGEPPVRIHVSHGTIEVIGTRFTVSQHAGGGYVDLFEGRIRFVGLGGQRREIEPGQRHAWGDAAEPEPSEVAQAELLPAAAGRGRTGAATHDGAEPDPIVVVEAEPPPVEPRAKARGSRRAAERPAKPEPVEASAEDATAIIDQVTALRAAGRYADAAEVLRRAERGRRWDRRTAQVLSYELGEIVERHLGDADQACAHWARHAARFPGGRYDGAVAAARERLGCPDAGAGTP